MLICGWWVGVLREQGGVFTLEGRPRNDNEDWNFSKTQLHIHIWYRTSSFASKRTSGLPNWTPKAVPSQSQNRSTLNAMGKNIVQSTSNFYFFLMVSCLPTSSMGSLQYDNIIHLSRRIILMTIWQHDGCERIRTRVTLRTLSIWKMSIPCLIGFVHCRMK